MMRAVLAVALAAALLAVAAPAVQDATAERTARSVAGDLRALGHAADSLADGEAAVPAGTTGARRTVVVAVPAASRTSAGVDYVAVGSLPAAFDSTGVRDGPDSDVLAVRVDGGKRVVVPVATDLRVGDRDAPDDRALVLRADGSHRLRLRLVAGPDGSVVVVERPRGFIPEDAARPAHAGHPRPAPAIRGGLPV